MPNRKQFKSQKDYLQWYRLYREKNAKKLRDYNREYNRIWRRDFGYANEENSDKRYPKKVRARKLLQRAVYQGLIKKEPCEVCKRFPSQAHHDDYDFPLSVKWLCALHHTEVHKSIKLST